MADRPAARRTPAAPETSLYAPVKRFLESLGLP